VLIFSITVLFYCLYHSPYPFIISDQSLCGAEQKFSWSWKTIDHGHKCPHHGLDWATDTSCVHI